MATEKQYEIEYRILDEPETRNLYHGVPASSVAQATDRAEKMLIKDGLPFASFEIVKVEVATTAEAVLDKASKMSKAELFLRELQATDEPDYKVLSDRLAALWEEIGGQLTLEEFCKLTSKIEEELQQKEIKEHFHSNPPTFEIVPN